MASVGLHGVQEAATRTNAPPNETTKETKRPDASKGGDDPLRMLVGIRWRFTNGTEVGNRSSWRARLG